MGIKMILYWLCVDWRSPIFDTGSTSGFIQKFIFQYFVISKTYLFGHKDWLISTNNSSKWSVESQNNFYWKKIGFGVKLQFSAHLGSNFEIRWKWVNCISKWRSWRQNFKKRLREVTRGHPRSKIQDDVSRSFYLPTSLSDARGWALAPKGSWSTFNTRGVRLTI